jgi:LysM repeat protein
MAHSFSRGSWLNRRFHRFARRQYAVFAVVCVVAITVVLHRAHSSTHREAAAKSADPAATASSAAMEIRKLAAKQGTGSPSGKSSETVALAASQSVTKPNPAVAMAISQARDLASQPGQVIAARDKLSDILSMSMSPAQLQTTKEQLSDLADKWLFSPIVLAGDALCEMYVVKPGESLETIGRRCKVPYETLMHINKIGDARSLQAGQQIKLIHGPFRAKIYRSTYTLDLYLQDTFVRSFKVALGAPGTETPTGLWRVKEGGKLIQPPWFDKKHNRNFKPTDPDYPLGPRWIELDGLTGDAKGRTGFAIHGTKDPESIGTSVSQGCIRMHNDDVLLMYDLLFPLASRVEISD